MKKTFIIIILLAVFSVAKADLVVDSLGTVRIGRGIINVAELGLTNIANGQLNLANIENATITNISADQLLADTINSEYAQFSHAHFNHTLSKSASVLAFNSSNATIFNLTSESAFIDSISTDYITLQNTNEGVVISPLGIKNQLSNEALYFEKDCGMFFYDGVNYPNYYINRRNYAFSIGTSRPNLYLHNYGRVLNQPVLSVAVEFGGALFFSGTNKSTNDNTCQIKADGTFCSRTGYITASDGSLKENIQSVTNVLDGISEINPVSYNLKAPTTSTQTDRSITNEEETRTKYGFIAQELEKIFPNVVYIMPTGEKGIAYQELIPILVSAIQEQQELIDNLVDEVEALKQPVAPQRQQAPAAMQEAIADGEAMLMQNTPNPFNQATEIGYRLPEGTATAMIMLCDMNGKMLQTYPLAVNDTAGTLTIQAGSYTPGMYLYTLLIDGVQIDTKQMIILAH